ncbi:GNAT family N-acetyltransferase [Maridesulfovibrio sp.]|uniref:GNAT family N-acetyltransferase n=1 Tax=Maridesulfovibrio sp. TaxID=2795000 RepID=UPI002A18A8A4|nr:GNAT family N-acetyltransferase [Maridesulfovibrio sp.]
MIIRDVTKTDYSDLIELWERSVRATHDFLTDGDIEYLRPLILEQYFDAVELKCVNDSHGKILGFCGVAEGNLEMLFVDPQSRGKGVGSALCAYVIDNLAVTKVDVNEQNPQALGFYEHIGFRVVGRSALDGQGKPFPLLHMEFDFHRTRGKV